MPSSSDVEFRFADGIFVKAITIRGKGSMVPQHSHASDHVSFLAVGELECWRDGVHIGHLKAPQGIAIEAGKKHAFLTMTDETVLLCIHNLGSEANVKILAEHNLTLDDAKELVRMCG